MKLLMENWRKFLKEETSVERMRRQRQERERKREEERAARDTDRDKEWRLKKGDWTKEDKEYVLLTYEDEIEDFEETYGRKPRKMEVAQYISKRIPPGSSAASPLHKEIGRHQGDYGTDPEMGAIRLYDVYRKDIQNSILPLPGKSGFEKWAERAEREAGGKPADFAKKMIQWMRDGAVISSHPHGIEAGLADAQIGTILRLTHLTLDDIFENMEILVKNGLSPEQAAQAISDTDEHATMDNPDFDPDQEEGKDNPQRIDLVIADPKIILRIYKYYKAAGF